MKCTFTPSSSTDPGALFDAGDDCHLPLDLPPASLTGLTPPPRSANHNSRSLYPQPLLRQDQWDYEELPSPRCTASPRTSSSPLESLPLRSLNEDPEPTNMPEELNTRLIGNLYMKFGACLALVLANSSAGALIDWLAVMNGCLTKDERHTHGSCVTENNMGALLMMIIGGLQIIAESILFHCLVGRGRWRGALVALLGVLPVCHLLFGIAGQSAGWAISNRIASDGVALTAGRILFTPLVSSAVSWLSGVVVIFACDG